MQLRHASERGKVYPLVFPPCAHMNFRFK
jgi:hypothetical protein